MDVGPTVLLVQLCILAICGSIAKKALGYCVYCERYYDTESRRCKERYEHRTNQAALTQAALAPIAHVGQETLTRAALAPTARVGQETLTHAATASATRVDQASLTERNGSLDTRSPELACQVSGHNRPSRSTEKKVEEPAGDNSLNSLRLSVIKPYTHDGHHTHTPVPVCTQRSRGEVKQQMQHWILQREKQTPQL